MERELQRSIARQEIFREPSEVRGHGRLAGATVGYAAVRDAVGQLRSTAVEQDFGVSEQRREGLSIISPRGEIDVATAPALRDHLETGIGRDSGPVVVDLTSVTFIDSTGLGVLIGAQKHCDDAGREFRVVVADPRIRKVFEITGLTDHFAMHDSLDTALKA